MITQGTKKLFLLDSYALIYRAYFAFIKNPRINSKGLDTSAIYGYLNSLLELVREEKPTHLAAVFDLKGPTFRHEKYPAYKANRDAMPEGISGAIPYIKKSLEALNIPQVSLEGYEADDIIGTLSKHAEKEGFQTYMVTPDKDFGQLVTNNTFIYKPGSRFSGPKVMGEKEVCEKYGLNNINQFIDFLGIMGDSSDNIPGVFGVGEKTAQKLITEYGSIENVYANIEDVKGKLKEKLLNAREDAFLSKDLVTISIDAPVEFSISEFKLTKPNFSEIENLFELLEFKQILNRVKKIFNSSSKENQIKSENIGVQTDLFSQIINNTHESSSPQFYKKQTIINNLNDINNLKSKLLSQKEVSFYVKKNNQNIHSLYLSFDRNNVFIIHELQQQIPMQKIQEFIRDLFVSNLLKLSYDFKNQWRTIGLNLDEFVPQNMFDIMLAAYLANSDERNEQYILINKILNIDLLKDENTLDKQGDNHISNLVVLNFKLREELIKILDKSENIDLLNQLEIPLTSILFKMENQGFNLDINSLQNFSKKLIIEVDEIKKIIFDISGKEFNISSPKQLGEVLFLDLGLEKNAKKTKTGQFSTSEQNLQRLKKNHPIIDHVLKYRSLEKLYSTYVEALPNLVNNKTKKIHTTFNQAVAATGRLSSKSPNLQNIPIRTKYGQEIRRAFIPSNNQILFAADYSQIELRLIAEFSSEPTMKKAFLENKDIHSITASKLFKVPFEEVTREMRSNAKTVNFGIIYGVSAFGLSQQTNLNRKESAELIKTYFDQYKQLKVYMNNQISFARDHGYVKTILGRKRHLKDINSRNALLRSHAERNAINAPIQGSAADLIKKAMIEIHNEFDSLKIKSKMILQVHDELIFDVLPSEKDIVKMIVKTKMEGVYDTSIPLRVEFGFGKNWLEAH
ncbi:MAG: DNA polymerase I [Flavobacteriales bacterium]|nr:DNA polymerase I [Flavobacteriales bacterium]